MASSPCSIFIKYFHLIGQFCVQNLEQKDWKRQKKQNIRKQVFVDEFPCFSFPPFHGRLEVTDIYVADESQPTIIIVNTHYTYILVFSSSKGKLHNFLIF